MAISNFVSRYINGKSPVIYGDGTQTRDFTYVSDVVDVPSVGLNIGSTDNIEIWTLASEIHNQLAPELELEFAERHDADADHTHADTSKAADILGYEPSFSIREGVSQFVEWCRRNREWYEPLVLRS